MKRIEWSKDALADIDRITDYFAGENPAAGERIVERIEAAAKKLRRRDTGREGRMPGIREKRVLRTRYVIAFAWSEKKDAVIVLRVIHGAQNWTAESWPNEE